MKRPLLITIISLNVLVIGGAFALKSKINPAPKPPETTTALPKLEKPEPAPQTPPQDKPVVEKPVEITAPTTTTIPERTVEPEPTTGIQLPKDSISSTPASYLELQLRDINKRVKEVEINISTLYDNQLSLKGVLDDLRKRTEKTEAHSKENRSYISILYQKTLDIDLQIQSLGGGFTNKGIKSKDEPNPLLGTDSLPSR